MNKTPDPGEVVRDKVVPAVEELVASIAERVAPFAQDAVEQLSPAAHAAAGRTVALAHLAADKVAPLTQQTRDAVTPYAQQAAELVGPYAQQVGPLAQQAVDRVGPLAQQAAGAVAPYAALLVEQGRKSSLDLADRLDAAKGAIAGAKDKVTSEYVPAVGAAAASAAASATPLAAAAAAGGKALVKGAPKEPAVVLPPPPPPSKTRGRLATVAVLAAAAGAAYVVVRKLVGDKGSQWQTARPTTPYTPPVSAEAGVAQAATGTEPASTGPTDVVASTTSLYGTVGSDASTGGVVDTDAEAIDARTEKIDQVADVDDGRDSAPAAGQTTGTWGEGSATDAGTPYSDEHVQQSVSTAEERIYEEPEAAVWAEQDTAMGGGPDAHPERYDLPGTYVGVEPPEGYTIKGNERSMKYHTPDSNGWSRTIAQVWFDSEEAAQRAGFSRAES